MNGIFLILFALEAYETSPTLQSNFSQANDTMEGNATTDSHGLLQTELNQSIETDELHNSTVTSCKPFYDTVDWGSKEICSRYISWTHVSEIATKPLGSIKQYFKVKPNAECSFDAPEFRILLCSLMYPPCKETQNSSVQFPCKNTCFDILRNCWSFTIMLSCHLLPEKDCLTISDVSKYRSRYMQMRAPIIPMEIWKPVEQNVFDFNGPLHFDQLKKMHEMLLLSVLDFLIEQYKKPPNELDLSTGRKVGVALDFLSKLLQWFIQHLSAKTEQPPVYSREMNDNLIRYAILWRIKKQSKEHPIDKNEKEIERTYEPFLHMLQKQIETAQTDQDKAEPLKFFDYELENFLQVLTKMHVGSRSPAFDNKENLVNTIEFMNKLLDEGRQPKQSTKSKEIDGCQVFPNANDEDLVEKCRNYMSWTHIQDRSLNLTEVRKYFELKPTYYCSFDKPEYRIFLCNLVFPPCTNGTVKVPCKDTCYNVLRNCWPLTTIFACSELSNETCVDTKEISTFRSRYISMHPPPSDMMPLTEIDNIYGANQNNVI